LPERVLSWLFVLNADRHKDDGMPLEHGKGLGEHVQPLAADAAPRRSVRKVLERPKKTRHFEANPRIPHKRKTPENRLTKPFSGAGADGETRTRTIVDHYPLKMIFGFHFCLIVSYPVSYNAAKKPITKPNFRHAP
jgi:hypothetical protein